MNEDDPDKQRKLEVSRHCFIGFYSTTLVMFMIPSFCDAEIASTLISSLVDVVSLFDPSLLSGKEL